MMTLEITGIPTKIDELLAAYRTFYKVIFV
jgi:hypothetical protein